MKCPVCEIAFHPQPFSISNVHPETHDSIKQFGFCTVHAVCPGCDQFLVILQKGKYWEHDQYGSREMSELKSEEIIFPISHSGRRAPTEVPKIFGDDFFEASAVISISPKASAAISRRILQHVLRDELKIKPGTLDSEIEIFINSKGVPTELANAVDAVRQVGNFAAHPTKNINTGEIVDVEAGESEWLLDVIDALFGFVFVQPKKIEARKNALNVKLSSIGKPPLKASV